MKSTSSRTLAAAFAFLFFASTVAAAQEPAAHEDSDTDARRELPNFQRVNERLYRGGQPTERGLRRLAALGVRTVVNLRADDERARREGEQARALGLRYFNFPLERIGRPDADRIAELLALVRAPEHQPVFVHCQRGADRTGMVVAAYRIAHDDWTAVEATREAKRLGLRFWQRGMKDFIQDFDRRRRGDASVAPEAQIGDDGDESAARRALHHSERLLDYLHRTIVRPVLR
ncbi:MAG TPA: tyrosine-protein phosphatase [Pyrinomonadaceae bacterium]|nr:tyrosine-protein phosphatase [Pyrinomonadaceae bacterium]